MATRYKLKVKKDQREEVLEKYPNLTSPVFIEIKVLEAGKRLEQVKHEKAKRFVEKMLRKGTLHINPDYPLNQREEVRAVSKRGLEWKGKVTIPDKAVRLSRELDEKQEIEI